MEINITPHLSPSKKKKIETYIYFGLVDFFLSPSLVLFLACSSEMDYDIWHFIMF